MKINEYFTSIQGEGLFIGEPHFFLRLSMCNLDCSYCDTDFNSFKEISPEEMVKITLDEYSKQQFSKISITGGEPLLQAQSLKKYLEFMNKKVPVLLETNSTLPDELNEIIDFIDVVSLDFKIDYHLINTEIFKEFFNIIEKNNKEKYIKIVMDDDYDKMIESISVLESIVTKHTVVILQPKTPINSKQIDNAMKIISVNKKMNLRLIPQIHPFLNIK